MNLFMYILALAFCISPHVLLKNKIKKKIIEDLIGFIL